MARAEQFQDYINRLFPAARGHTSDGRRVLSRTVTFQVTDACTLRCTYCYQGIKAHHVLPFETARKFIDLILTDKNPYMNTRNSPGIIIEFIGGEPLLEIGLIDKITDYFLGELIRLRHPWATRFRISICSNGTEYFDPQVQAYLKKHLAHLSFSVSIDGNRQLHDACRVFPDGRGSYDTAIRAVEHFTQVLGGKMGSKMTIAPQNVGYVFEALKNLLALGYREINLNCVYEKGWELSHARTLYGQLKQCADHLIYKGLDDVYVSMFEEHFFKPMDPSHLQNWCGGTGDMLSVDHTGNLYPCIRYMPNALGSDQEPLTVGHVDHGLLGTEKERACAQCLQHVDRRTQSTDECFFCPIAEGCAWCSAYNYQVFGTADKRANGIVGSGVTLSGENLLDGTWTLGQEQWGLYFLPPPGFFFSRRCSSFSTSRLFAFIHRPNSPKGNSSQKETGVLLFRANTKHCSRSHGPASLPTSPTTSKKFWPLR